MESPTRKREQPSGELSSLIVHLLVLHRTRKRRGLTRDDCAALSQQMYNTLELIDAELMLWPDVALLLSQSQDEVIDSLLRNGVLSQEPERASVTVHP